MIGYKAMVEWFYRSSLIRQTKRPGPDEKERLLHLATRPGPPQGLVDAMRELWLEEAPGGGLPEKVGSVPRKAPSSR